MTIVAGDGRGFLDEEVFPMPPLSMSAAEQLGEAFLDEVWPDALKEPGRLPIQQLVEDILPLQQIFVYPVSSAELPDREGATLPFPGPEINILVRADSYDNITRGGRRSHRGRATVMHEVGHAVLHVPLVRRRRQFANPEVSLNRVSRAHLRPYEDPEWQAWALAGCIVAPRRTIMMLRDRSPGYLADIYGVSEALMRSHLRRLRLLS